MEASDGMRRIALIGVVLALVAVACGDDDGGGSLFTTTTAAPSTSTGEQYPAEFVSAYMEGCTTESSTEFCRCTIDAFQDRMTLAEFLALTADDFDPVTDPTSRSIIELCLRGGGPGTTSTTLAGGTFTSFASVEEVSAAAIADLEAYWAFEMPAIWGLSYETLDFIGPYFISQGDRPRCGGPLAEESYVGNAFYCGFDDTIQWDHETLMTPLFEEFGDFTVALVLAHEWGHAIQERYGFDDRLPTIVSELQADCFAGAWTGRVAANETPVFRLAPGDLEEAMAGFLLIGDGLGSAPGGPNAHGGSFDRLNAFFDGFQNGAGRCAEYEEDRPTIVFIGLVEGDDPIEGGDLPLADAPDILAEALEVFWGIVYPETWGAAWVPVSDWGPYFPSTGNLPQCGGFTNAESFYPGNAFYCADDDYVAWDGEGLFPGLYTEIGDFALGLVLANEWGRAVLDRRGLATDGPEAQVRVDCMAGVWTAAMTFDENPMQLYLSAGDLEEAIAGLLALSASPGSDGAVTAFQRFDAFRSGFFDGIGACDVP